VVPNITARLGDDVHEPFDVIVSSEEHVSLNDVEHCEVKVHHEQSEMVHESQELKTVQESNCA